MSRPGYASPPSRPAGQGGRCCSLSHSRHAEIKPIGEEARHEDLRIGGSFTRPQMGETVGEQRPLRHLDPARVRHRFKSRCNSTAAALWIRPRRTYRRRDQCAVLLRPGKTPSGTEIRGHQRRLIRRIRRHWPQTRITIRGKLPRHLVWQSTSRSSPAPTQSSSSRALMGSGRCPTRPATAVSLASAAQCGPKRDEWRGRQLRRSDAFPRKSGSH